MTPRMLPNGSTTEAVTKPPVPRSVMGSWIDRGAKLRVPAARARGRLGTTRRRPHRPQRTQRHRGAAAVPAARAGGVDRAGGEVGAAQARARPARHVPRRGGDGGERRRRGSDRVGRAGEGASAAVKILQAAVVRCRKVRLVYARPGREPSERMVDPWGLVDKEDVWYLVAGTKAGQRTFRVDRIVDASVTALPFERPADFELADAWGRVVDEMEQLRSMLSATVLISAKFVRVRVRVAAPTATMIAQQLAGWGAM